MTKTLEREETKDDLRRRIQELEAANEHLATELDTVEDENGDLKDEVAQTRKLYPAIDAVLDEVERPTGSLNCTLPTNEHTSRALLGLFDAIGRRP